jgi:hypothetical protein
MSHRTSADADADTDWREFREALCLRQRRAELRLLATVTSLVSFTGTSLPPDARAELCVGVAAALARRVRTQRIRSAPELLLALDLELAGRLPGRPSAALTASTVLLVRLGDAIAALPDAQQRALSAYYAGEPDPDAADARARRDALAVLRGQLPCHASSPRAQDQP